jgi:hypothetical protein
MDIAKGLAEGYLSLPEGSDPQDGVGVHPVTYWKNALRRGGGGGATAATGGHVSDGGSHGGGSTAG